MMITAIAGFLISLVLVSCFQLKHISAKEGAKGVFAYVLLMSLAAVIGALLIAGVEIPRQSLTIRIFEPIGKYLLGK